MRIPLSILFFLLLPSLALPEAAHASERLDLAPADANRVDALETQQRGERQLLEQDHQLRQLMLERRASVEGSGTPNPRLDMHGALLRQERELQAREFELDRQRLLQSLPRQPLQPRTDPGRLVLP